LSLRTGIVSSIPFGAENGAPFSDSARNKCDRRGSNPGRELFPFLICLFGRAFFGKRRNGKLESYH
jgi:hypothetical protein